MALLDRVLQRGPADPGGFDDVDESRMTILEHLEALRRVLIVSMIGWAICTAVAFIFWGRILVFLQDRGHVGQLQYFTPTGGFTLGIKIALIVGLIAAAPVWIQQLWWFVSPGLHRHERRLVLPLVAATIFFFAVGITFALFSLPLFLKILSGFAPSDLHYLPVGDDYLNFVLFLILGFGIVFELPVVIFVLGVLRVITSKWLYANRFYWIIGLGILSNMMTPGVDPITPLFMWIPLYIFWEGTALLLKLTGR
ncbi:MAG: twin-arginine translocase subunit TatC [Chloroflexi bacterium]|nr:MAG: twin-arginine translocase subunit TatC [Chloroflexota bacterium]